MASSPPRPCTYVGCGRLVHGGGSRCPAHARIETDKFNDRRRGSRHQRGYGSAWDKLREQIMLRDKGVCQPCWKLGKATPAHAVDHIKAKHEGGTDDCTNLQAICRACHAAKTQREAASARRAAWD